MPKYSWQSLLCTTLLPISAGFCFWQGWNLWSKAISPVSDRNSTIASDKGIIFNIPPGTPVQKIGEDLEAAGLIRSDKAWRLWTLWLKFTDKRGGYQAGTYELSPKEPLSAIAQKIWQGEIIHKSFTIPEGWRIRQMAEHFESLGYFSVEEFRAAVRKISKEKYPWLPDGLPHLEGFLFPDTYSIPGDRPTPEQIIDVMLSEFERVALPVYQQYQNQTKFSLLEWVTLASIVEKEAVVPQERSLIAGVFINRLKLGMRLESDPTVEYGLGIKQTADRPLTFAQVRTRSSYNTYLNSGLPPTPIASPGLASLKATLAPEDTEYLFFVARYDGTHVFSKTLTEHEEATKVIRRERKTS